MCRDSTLAAARNEANAAVIGFGRSRRVVLADTLLSTFTPEEIESVVAHELGHHVHRDIARPHGAADRRDVRRAGRRGAGRRSLARPVRAGPLASPATFPLTVFGAELFGLLTHAPCERLLAPVEAEADTYAFQLLGSGRPFAAAMRRLADQNLAEQRPPRWAEIVLYTSPADRAAHRQGGGRQQVLRFPMFSWVAPSLLALFILPAIAYGGYSVGDRWYQNYVLGQEEAAMRADVQRLRETNARLQRELEAARGDAQIEKAAREQLGLISRAIVRSRSSARRARQAPEPVVRRQPPPAERPITVEKPAWLRLLDAIFGR